MGNESNVNPTGNVTSLTCVSRELYNFERLLLSSASLQLQFSFNQIPPAIKNRIKRACLHGIVSSGIGCDFVRDVVMPNFGLSYLHVYKSNRHLPSLKGYQLRPGYLELHYVPRTFKALLTEYHTADQARWRLLAGDQTMPSSMAAGVRYSPDKFTLYLSGLQSLEAVHKHFTPHIMTEERKTAGKAAWEALSQSQALKLSTG